MKRLLLLPILMFGLSFACDQPYEEVAGIKIGCPLGDSDGYKGYLLGPEIYGADSHYKQLDKDNFFEVQWVLSIDGIAEGVALVSESGVTEEEFEFLAESLEERWGEPSVSDESRSSTVVAFKKPSSRVVANIVAGRDKEDGSARLLYQSKKSIDADQKEENEKKANIKKGFEGL